MQTTRNFFAASLRAGQFQPRKVRPVKGKGSFQRRPKHKGRAFA
jgi:stalled ribosome alternative rescue factor ArfA